MNITKEKIQATIEAVRAVADAIKELGTVPSGHLYARLMGFCTLEQYQKLIDILVNAGLVTVGADHLITWKGE